jgi:hypothetical protein
MEFDPSLETMEGPQAEKNFAAAVTKILSIPREEMQRPQAAYKRPIGRRPEKAWPKRKRIAAKSRR